MGAELSFHHQVAVSEERVVRTDRIYVDSYKKQSVNVFRELCTIQMVLLKQLPKYYQHATLPQVGITLLDTSQNRVNLHR